MAAIIGSQSMEFNGGAERNVLQIAKILNSLGYEVTVFAPPRFDNKNIDIDTSFFTYNNTVFNRDIFAKKPILKITGGISIGFVGLLSFKYIFSIIKNYDLYYFVNPNFLFGKSMKYFYYNDMHPKIILGNHGTYFEILNRKLYRKPLLHILNFLIFYYAKRKTFKIQVQNDMQNSFYSNIGMSPGSLIEVPQCNIDFNKYGVKPHSEFNLVFLNKLVKNKGFNVLEDIIQKTEFNIHILGFHENLDKIQSKYSNRKNITFHGYVSEEEKEKILSESDLMLNMSEYESLSISTVEGLASGLHVVAPDISGINTLKRLVPDGISTVEKRKPDYYNKIINYYSSVKSSDPVGFQKAREITRQKAMQYFDKTVIEKSIEDMILKKPENKENISIVTASLNEKSNIKIFLDQVMSLIRTKNIRNLDEIVIVDDGSTDGTVNIIETFAKENEDISIVLVKRNKKMGTVDAQITGAKQAKNEYILIMDCDLQHPIQYIENFVEKFNYGYDIIIGSRYIVGGKNNWEPERGIISRVATMIAHVMFPFTYKIKDPLSGYFLCRRHMLADLKPYRYMYKPLLYLLIFNNKDRNYIEIPIEMVSRKGGESKIVNSYSRTILMYSREILIYYRDYNKSRWKFN